MMQKKLMSQNGTSTKRAPRRNGEITPQGRRNQIASRTTFGVRAGTSVLVGVEDPGEWERFLAGFLDVWNPVGQHEHECVAGIADGFWRLRRVRRYVSETTVSHLLEAAQEEPPEVQRQIESLIGAPVIKRSVLGDIEIDTTHGAEGVHGNGDGKRDSISQPPSITWWQKILYSPDETELSRAETEWILTHVTQELLADDNDDGSEDEEDGDEDNSFAVDRHSAISLPEGPITLKAIRAQLTLLQQGCENRDSTVGDILLAGLEAAREEAELVKLSLVQAQRFIAAHLLLPEPTITTAQVYERQILCVITRHMNMLERLQAQRRGQEVPAPISVDVNLTATRKDLL